MLNRTFFIGRLTRDPELKYTTSGVAVTNFSLAVNRNYTNQNGVRETDFIDVVAYRKLAEIICRYTKKGSLLEVDGHIQTRYYDHSKGVKMKVYEVIAENVVFLDTKSRDNTQVSKETQEKADEYFDNIPQTDISEDDLPF